MQRNSSPWLYDSDKADKSFYVTKNLLSYLNEGDVIKIDGEDGYRDVQGLPRFVNPKDYRPGSEVSSKYFGSIKTTNYNGDISGSGLSVTCTIEGGKVTAVDWNKKSLKLYYDTGVIEPTTAYGYNTPPILHFIPEDGAGGGATAEVIVSKGQIVDIKLTSSGSGYTKAPRVSVARKYTRIKRRDRKIDSFVGLIFSTALLNQSPANISSEIVPIKGTETIGGIVPGGPSGAQPGGGSYPAVEHKPKIVSTFQLVHTLGGFNVSHEIVRTWPTSVTSAPMGSSVEIEIEKTRVIRSVATLDVDLKKQLVRHVATGAVDTHFAYNNTYSSAVLGPTPQTFNRVSYSTVGGQLDLGDVLSTGGIPVSEYTLEEISVWNFTIEEINDAVGTNFVGNIKWNFVNPSINYYITQLNTSDLPDANGGGYLATGAIVYANTTNFASSGTIFVGREKISYTGKLSDRFTGCERGVDNSPIEEHLIGEYIRNAL